MKLDDKKKKIQLNYRKKMNKRTGEHQHHKREVFMLSILLLILIVLFVFFKDSFYNADRGVNVQIYQVD